MNHTSVQYTSDKKVKIIGVIIPIELWREIESEKETSYLLKSKKMKKRLLEVRSRKVGITLEEISKKLGI
jgi:hypothetical protein